MRPLAFVCAFALLFACGESGSRSTGDGEVGFDLYVSAAAIDEIGSFQLTLLKTGALQDCGAFQGSRTCLKTQVEMSNVVRFEDAKGARRLALVVPNELSTTGTVRTQDTTLRNVPTGKKYFLIVEALSRENPPKLLGASCKQNIEVRSGNNERIQAEPILFYGAPADGGTDAGLGVACDPRFE